MRKYNKIIISFSSQILLKYLMLVLISFNVLFVNGESLWLPLKTNIPERKVLNCYSLSNLPNKDVCRIIKDKQGFLWIGTFDGLYRFDGVHYKMYSTTSPENKIQSNMIHSISESKDGTILVSFYSSGCCEIDYNKNKISSFIPSKMLNDSSISNNVFSIVKKNNGDILIAIKNGIVLHSKDNKNKLLDLKHFGIDKKEFIKNIYVDKLDNLWLSTFNKLHKIEKGVVKQTYDLKVNNISFYDSEMLIATNNGVFLLTQDNKKSLRKIDRGIFKKVIFSGKDICAIKEDQINYYSKINNEWKLKFYLDKTRINENFILENMSDCISFSYKWIFCASSTNGIIAINKMNSFFENISLDNNYPFLEKDCVRSLFEDKYDKIWIGYEKNKLTIIDRIQHNTNVKKIPITENKTSNVLSMEEMHFESNGIDKDLIFLGNRYSSPLIAYSLNNYKKNDFSYKTDKIGNVFVLKQINVDSTKLLWAGTYGNGLSRIKFTKDGDISKISTFNKKREKLNSNIIRSLEKTVDGNLYIGSDCGLNLIPRSELKKEIPNITKIRLSKDSEIEPYVIQLRNVNDSILAIGTMSRGLIFYNIKSNKYQTVTKEDGLPSNKIKIMLLDDNGNLWIGGGKSITKYNYESKELIVFNVHSGLPDVNFVETCCTKLKNGKILFGTTNSIIAFKPENINKQLRPNDPIITKFEARTKNKIEYEYANKFIEQIYKNKEIKIPYSNNNISITFSSPNIISGLNNIYEYRLLKNNTKKEEAWKQVDAKSNKLYFANLHEGKYQFQLKTNNITNTSSSKPVFINIIVSPPFFRSKLGVFIIIVITFIIIFLLLFFIRKASIKRKTIFKKIQEKEKETEQIKKEITTLLTQNENYDIKDEYISLGDKDLLKKVVSMIKENISNPDYTTKTISTECGMSSVTLNKKISSLTGQTIFQIQTKIKLNIAKKLLKNSNLNINEIAWKVGYNDANAFRRKFKSTFNMTPSEWTNKNYSK